MAEHRQQRAIEQTAAVTLRRTEEFVAEAEAVQKRLESCIVVRAKTRMCAERIGNRGQWFAEIFAQHLLIGHIVRHFPQAIHVIRKRYQTSR